MDLELCDLRDGYVTVLTHVLSHGKAVVSRGLSAREVTGARLVFTEPLEPLLPIALGRSVNSRLAAVEALQLVAGEFHAELVQRATPTFGSVLVDPEAPDYGAYGPRLGYALGDCVNVLRDDLGSRQAVALIWRPEDLEHAGDKPCTVFLQFLVRTASSEPFNDVPHLELYAYMRSQDAWLGVPYDVFMFSQLQHTIARELHLPAGRYVHVTTSLHLYERDIDAATDLVTRHLRETAVPELTTLLPLGVVSVDPSETGFDVASRLLNNTATTAERDANRWFVERLGPLLEVP